ncbi:MAG: 1,4-alpha-glucan branching enzyme, partial [Cyanobacteria bacterium J06621_11]
MSSTIALEQIERIVRNQHQNPFEVLGPHTVEQDGKKAWAVRTYLPNADSAWVVFPEERKEYAMENEQHPQFFEALLTEAELTNYQIRYK